MKNFYTELPLAFGNSNLKTTPLLLQNIFSWKKNLSIAVPDGLAALYSKYKSFLKTIAVEGVQVQLSRLHLFYYYFFTKEDFAKVRYRVSPKTEKQKYQHCNTSTFFSKYRRYQYKKSTVVLPTYASTNKQQSNLIEALKFLKVTINAILLILIISVDSWVYFIRSEFSPCYG